MKNVSRPTYSYLILVIGLIVIDTLLAWVSAGISHLISPTLPAGVAVIALAAAFMVIFTLWFGMYGAIAAYVGGLFGASIFGGMSGSVALYLSLANLWMVLVPLAAFRIFEANAAIESRRDLFHLVLFGAILNNIIAAAWGSISLAVGGVIGWNGIMAAFVPWFAGNAIFTIIIAPLVLSRYTPRAEKSKVFVRNFWF
ncbi:hypothetical protein Mboo_0110 [Methanoregula boonei 6A8]|jgi:hypothetical protein|uniref:Uncharacterized protein n=1 Tax=Methanoregula boonei (strain DSM 21154 / JCM 14090 / 6A8) TaxID=456442 RepID=A7I4H3_METB6|nr:hypothetical protein [Methanoregula boonei]ABS54634.1 hypothetical protein Mboo_0110 [Methanoregula boonei 6A8]